MNLKVDRRKFLRGAGIGLALPLLESFETSAMNAVSSVDPVKRLVCIGTYLGFHQADFFPKRTGKSYEMPFVLEPLTPVSDTPFNALSRGSLGFALVVKKVDQIF